MNFDGINSVSPSTAVGGAFEIVTHIQTMPKAQQIASVAVLLHLLSRKGRVDIRRVLETTDNMLSVIEKDRDGDHLYSTINAYIEGEL